jgi:choline dehydrogenase-like flavoprotein
VTSEKSFDYVVVGAGAGGGVLAARLAEAGKRVLVLDAGDDPVEPHNEPTSDRPLPPDYQEKAEWVFGRLMYPQHPNARFGRYSRRYGSVLDWREGGTSWTQDYPRGDRHFEPVRVRRFTDRVVAADVAVHRVFGPVIDLGFEDTVRTHHTGQQPDRAV